MRSRAGLVRTLGLVILLGLAPSVASAQPAWIVGTSGADVSSPASTTVLLRHHTLTIETVALDYVGPAEPIAIVLPVPGPVDARRIRVVPSDVLERVDQVSSPRLVERWERDPCAESTRAGTTGLTHAADLAPSELGTMGHGAGSGTGAGYGSGVGGLQGVGYGDGAEQGETLTQGDYTIDVVTSETIEPWLTEHGYPVPARLGANLASIEAASVVVARLDAAHVVLVEGRAHLPALRLEYRAETLSLPLFGASVHDLVVEVLGPARVDVVEGGRLAPTGIAVAPDTSPRFASVYAAVLDRMLDERSAPITEYAWSAASCEGCPGAHPVRAADLATLGASVAFPDGVVPFRNQGFVGRQVAVPTVQLGVPEFRGVIDGATIHRVVQRHVNELRFCYEEELAMRPDLTGRVTINFIVSATGAVQTASVMNSTLNDERVEGCVQQAFRRWQFPELEGGGIAIANQPITFSSTGGRPDSGPSAVGDWILTRLHARIGSNMAWTWVLDGAAAIEGGRERDDGDAEPTRPRFQTRFVIRHPWEGAIACDAPTRDVWGAPPTGPAPEPVAATRDATAVDDAALAAAITVPLDSIGLAAPAPEADESDTPSSDEAMVAALTGTRTPPPVARPTPASPTGCGCRASVGDSGALALTLLIGSLVLARRRTLRARGRHR